MMYLYKFKFSFWVSVAVFLFSCHAGKPVTSKPSSVKSINYLGEYIIPYNQQFKNTTIGGLSGVDYDRENDLFYLICDDWSQTNPARFYTARIFCTGKGIDSVRFDDMVHLLRTDGTFYPGAKEDPYHTPDPEAIRFNPLQKRLVWTSEGERLITKDSAILQDPAIRRIGREGEHLDTFPLPEQIHMYATERGLRRNGVFEGLSFADGYNNLYVSIEEPLYEDGARAATGDSSAWVRLLKYDVNKKILLAEYAYQVDPVVRMPVPANGHKINGVSEILEIGKNKLLFVERSYSAGRTDCSIRLYIGDVSQATNIAAIYSLKEQKNFAPVRKTLLFNMDKLGMFIGNIEGVSFGPLLPNGHQTLIFVADNNFRATEKTQLLLFEIKP